MAAYKTAYPPVPLACLAPFADEPGPIFHFDDVQAATGLPLHECQKATGMLRAAGLLERFARNNVVKPKYRLPGVARRLLQPQPAGTGPAVADPMRMQVLIAAHNARGLPLKVTKLTLHTAIAPAQPLQTHAQLLLLVQTRREVAGEIVRLADDLVRAGAGRVDVVLTWA